MTDDQLEDLKQFIDSRISQSELRFDTKLDQKIGIVDKRIDTLDQKIGTLDQKIGSLRQEMLDGFAGVGEAIEEINQRFDDHIMIMHKQGAVA